MSTVSGDVGLRKGEDNMENQKQIGQTENIMGTLPIGGLLRKMAIPLILSLLVQALYSIVDSIYVAH